MKFEHLMAEAAKPAELNDARVAGLALELSHVFSLVTDALEPLKERLREIASKETENPAVLSGVTGDGRFAGTVMVTFPEKQVKLAKGADIEALKVLLGDTFEDYFEEAVTYRPRRDLPKILGERQRLKVAGTVETKAILDAVEYAEPTPRVGFKPSIPTE